MNRLRARAAEPRLEVAHADVQIPPHAPFRDRPVERREQIRRGDFHLVEAMQLVRPLHVRPNASSAAATNPGCATHVPS
jgi:hypothetical protein